MLTLTDLFCGAGGSSTGATMVPGIEVKLAANHWDLAIETHNANHPDADHLQADISNTDPRYIRTTDLLWASPECTNHSRAKGRKRIFQPDLFEETLPDAAAERSRATMWDVVRFAEVHQYKAIVVENVVEVVDWLPFQAWLGAMDALGYDFQYVSLNSMHAQTYGLPAPQSRDRVYIVFHRKGNPVPDLHRMQRPKAYCPTCDEVVDAMQAFKKEGAKVGRYRSQYVYRCPNIRCRNGVVEPAWLPASSIIDWSLPGTRIGDRDKPLAEKTMRRIQVGIERYWSPIHLEAAGNTYDSMAAAHAQFGRADGYVRAWPMHEPVRTLHTSESKGLAYDPVMVPVEGRDGKQPQSMADALRTQTTRSESGVAFSPLMVPAGGTWNDDARPASDAARTRTTRETEGFAFPPFLAELRGGGSTARRSSDSLSTVTASGNHHALVTSYYGRGGTIPADRSWPTVTSVASHGLIMRNNGGGAEMTTPAGEPVRTITTAGHQSVLTGCTVNIDDVRFRMLEPSEIKQAMAFPADYIMRGNRREQVKQSGNAVTPPAARDLLATVAASLGLAS